MIFVARFITKWTSSSLSFFPLVCFPCWANITFPNPHPTFAHGVVGEEWVMAKPTAPSHAALTSALTTAAAPLCNWQIAQCRLLANWAPRLYHKGMLGEAKAICTEKVQGARLIVHLLIDHIWLIDKQINGTDWSLSNKIHLVNTGCPTVQL